MDKVDGLISEEHQLQYEQRDAEAEALREPAQSIMYPSPEEMKQRLERVKRIRGIRQIADFLEEHPEIPLLGLALDSISIYLEYTEPKLTLDDLVKVWDAMGRQDFQESSLYSLKLTKAFDGMELKMIVPRAQAGRTKPSEFELDERLRVQTSDPAED